MKNKLPLICVLAASLAAPAVWLATVVPAEGLNFPSDDAWIHQVFARNLARSGILAYNPGERSAGVTAPFWAFLMSEIHFFRLPVVPTAIAFTIATHVFWALAIYWLVVGVWPNRSKWWAFAAAALFNLFGPVVWYSLSGMETSLFFGLATLAFAAYGQGRYGLAGGAASAAVPVRPEGALVLALVGAAFLLRLKKEKRRPHIKEVFAFAVLPAVFVIPFVIQNFLANGTPLPTTYFGRQWLYRGASGDYGLISWKGPAVMAFYWYRYLHIWTLSVHDLSTTASIITDPAILGQVGFWVAAVLFIRRKLPVSFALFFLWVILHNLVYGLFLPNFGTAGRYEGCNFAFVAVLSIYGAGVIYDLLRGQALRVLPFIFLAGLTVTAFGSYLAWRPMYADNIYHITNVHEAAGKWVAANLPRRARVAAFDIGAFGYYADRYIIDIGGLLKKDAARHLKEKTVISYLRQERADYVAMMEADTVDVKPLAERFGFYRDDAETFRLTPVKTFELPIARRRWLTLTAIAYPIMTIYKIDYLER